MSAVSEVGYHQEDFAANVERAELVQGAHCICAVFVMFLATISGETVPNRALKVIGVSFYPL